MNQQNGANLYAYCGNDPVNNSDPTGLYEIDVHQFLTQFLAEKAGFSHNVAVRIGAEAQGPDGVITPTGVDESRSAWDGKQINRVNMALYHFVDRHFLTAMTTSAGVTDDDSFKLLGEFLHAQEDTYAHSSAKGGRDFNYYGDVFGALDHGGYLGHGRLGHNPDQTWRDEQKAMKMAKRIYRDLRLIALNRPQLYPEAQAAGVTEEVDTPDPGWSAIEKTVLNFIQFRPNVVSTAGLVETVTFGGYNDKIKLLDSSFNVHERYKSVFPMETGYKAGTFWSRKINSLGSSYGNGYTLPLGY